MLHFDELTLFTKTEMCTNEGSCVVRTIQVTRVSTAKQCVLSLSS